MNAVTAALQEHDKHRMITLENLILLYYIIVSNR